MTRLTFTPRRTIWIIALGILTGVYAVSVWPTATPSSAQGKAWTAACVQRSIPCAPRVEPSQQRLP